MVEKVKKQEGILNLLKHRVLRDNVLIVPVDFETKGGAYDPKQYEDKPEFGLVLATGEGRRLEGGQLDICPVKTGDFIVYGKYSSTKVNADGIDFYYIRQEDIMSTFEV